ncbi:MAG: hypothetical protein H6662_15670 [Ardenticatenaceae bacterium]|nr:hypothetical protein [Ardenticatenaceae bacterium]
MTAKIDANGIELDELAADVAASAAGKLRIIARDDGTVKVLDSAGAGGALAMLTDLPPGLSDYKNVIVVDSGGNGDYTTLSAAIASIVSGTDTVHIFQFGNITELVNVPGGVWGDFDIHIHFFGDYTFSDGSVIVHRFNRLFLRGDFTVSGGLQIGEDTTDLEQIPGVIINGTVKSDAAGSRITTVDGIGFSVLGSRVLVELYYNCRGEGFTQLYIAGSHIEKLSIVGQYYAIADLSRNGIFGSSINYLYIDDEGEFAPPTDLLVVGCTIDNLESANAITNAKMYLNAINSVTNVTFDAGSANGSNIVY